MVFRVVGVVADGMAGVVAEEQLEGGLFGQDGDLDGKKTSQLAMPGREEDMAAGSQRAAAEPTGRATSGVVEVIEDEQGVGPSGEFLEGDLELPVRGLTWTRAEPGTEWARPLSSGSAALTQKMPSG